MSQSVAVIGATGAVGREMLVDLEPLKNLSPQVFASPRSEGQQIPFRGQALTVKAYSLEDVSADYVLMSSGGDFSRKHAPELVGRGKTVIDNSSAWRMDPKIPLVVPEVNQGTVKPGPGIIANPNCSTIQLVVALKPLVDTFGLKSIQVATYQSVSGSGQKGIRELGDQVQDSLKMTGPRVEFYDQPIAFNVLSGIGEIDDNGHCVEEVKIIKETRRILDLPDLEVEATTARVPVFSCHCEAVIAELACEVSRQQVVDALAVAPGVKLCTWDDPKQMPTPQTVVGDPLVSVSRVRLPYGRQTSSRVQFWVVADNLKKGAATNAVQILQQLLGAAK